MCNNNEWRAIKVAFFALSILQAFQEKIDKCINEVEMNKKINACAKVGIFTKRLRLQLFKFQRLVPFWTQILVLPMMVFHPKKRNF